MDKNSDLVVEFAEDLLNDNRYSKKLDSNNVVVKRIDISDKSMHEKYFDRKGIYYDIEINNNIKEIESVVSRCIKDFDYQDDKILLVGLGNAEYLSDALGEKVLDSVPMIKDKLVKFKPLVFNKTGLESYDLITSVVKLAKPTLIILVDSLATANIERIGRHIQITNVGLTPGSGVGNARKILTYEKLGVPIIAIGVPFVSEVITNNKKHLVSLINIEDVLNNCVQIITNGIVQAIKK